MMLDLEVQASANLQRQTIRTIDGGTYTGENAMKTIGFPHEGMMVVAVWANPWQVNKVERRNSLAVCFEKICHCLHAKPEDDSFERLDTFIWRVASPRAPSRKRTGRAIDPNRSYCFRYREQSQPSSLSHFPKAK